MGNRKAGKSTYELAEKRRMFGLRMGLILLAGMILLWIYFANPTLVKSLGSGVTVSMIMLLFILPDFTNKIMRKNKREESRAIQGADAEVKVDSILSNLDPSEYLIYNDIRSPFGNIDHIVLKNTGGVVLVETKSHKGKVTIKNGKVYINNKLPEKDFIKQVLCNSFWLKDRIQQKSGCDTWISPILVFTNALVELSSPVQGVNIVNVKYLTDMIRKNETSSEGGKKMWEMWKKSKSNEE